MGLFFKLLALKQQLRKWNVAGVIYAINNTLHGWCGELCNPGCSSGPEGPGKDVLVLLIVHSQARKFHNVVDIFPGLPERRLGEWIRGGVPRMTDRENSKVRMECRDLPKKYNMTKSFKYSLDEIAKACPKSVVFLFLSHLSFHWRTFRPFQLVITSKMLPNGKLEQQYGLSELDDSKASMKNGTKWKGYIDNGGVCF